MSSIAKRKQTLRLWLLRILFTLLIIGAWILILRNRVLPRWNGPWDGGASPHASGIFHVHSNASHDSRTSLDTIAQVAHTLGTQFVIVTDHNVQLERPFLLHGVLMVSYAELSTPFGHVVGLGADSVLPPDQRSDADVLPSLAALGGRPIVSHPTDVRNPWVGRWKDAGGMEIANFASSLRRQGWPLFLGLWQAFLALPVRHELALLQAYDRDDAALKRWDEHNAADMLGFCSVDAHGRLPTAWELAAWFIHLDQPLIGSTAEAKATHLLENLTRGNFFCGAGLLGSNPDFVFQAQGRAGPVADPGQNISASEVDSLVTIAPQVHHGQTQIVLLRNGQELTRTQEPSLRYAKPTPGTYRVEIRVPLPRIVWGERLVPVIYSNRIRISPNL